MKVATYVGFKDELAKIAAGGLGGHAAELAGLGILAAPSVSHMMGKNWSEKNKSRAEVGGLATLAAPSAIAIGKHLMKRGSVADGALSIFKQASDLWEPATGRVIGDVGSRAANRGMAAAGAAKAMSKPKFTMDTLKGLYKSQGLKPAITSVLKHAAVKKAAPVRLGVGAIGKHMLTDAFKTGTKPLAQAAAKTVAKPMAQAATAGGRTGLLHSFTPQSSVNMKRAIDF